jgi:PKD repeat protein
MRLRWKRVQEGVARRQRGRGRSNGLVVSVLAALAAVLVAFPTSGGAAAAVEIELQGEVVLEFWQIQGLPNDPNRCVTVQFLEFAAVPGAGQYTAVVLNPVLQTNQTFTAGPTFFPGDAYTVSAGPGFVHTFFAPAGTHRIVLGSGSSGQGCLTEPRFTFVSLKTTVDNPPPHAAFSWQPRAGQPLAIDFDASASTDDQSIADYAWSFGDGGTGSGQATGHVFAASGTYPVTLTVTDNEGATDTETLDVTVSSENEPPTASFTWRADDDDPFTVSFDGTGSTDDVGIERYDWDFGDGNTASGLAPPHTYENAGVYRVTLTVTDTDEASDSETQEVDVAACPSVSASARPGALRTLAGTVRCALVVNVNGDQSDPDVMDGHCDVDAKAGGDQCTLRAAIDEANGANRTGPDTIVFQLADPTIRPLSPLPTITDPVTIQGPSGGVELDGSAAGGDGVTIAASDCAVRAMTIVRFSGNGIVITGSAGPGIGGARIEGNRIGVRANGQAAGNGTGVFVQESHDNVVGGPGESQRNVIAGNSGDGIDLADSTGAVVTGNLIGVVEAAPGSFRAVPNGGRGVRIRGGGQNTIGKPGAGNVIAANGLSGIKIDSTRSTNNRIQANFIGVDPSGGITGILLGNGGYGIDLTRAPGTLIGGLGAGEGNLIGNSALDGILVSTPDLQLHDGVRIEGNFVGTGPDGAADSPLGNDEAGIHVVGWRIPDGQHGDVQITGNTIAANGTDAIGIGFSSHVVVRRNVIHSFGNGVLVIDASDTTVGGAPGDGNVIEDVGISGVGVVDSDRVAVLGNSIRRSGRLGIDLAVLNERGVTPNDYPGDPDDGANGFQNFPELASATVSGSGLRVEGELRSSRLTDFRVEFFANTACSPSGYGEGETFLGATTVRTDGVELAGISTQLQLAGPVSPGAFVTATATDPQGNTSEFSSCVKVEAAPDTALTAPAPAGITRLEVASNEGFLGRVVQIGSGATLEKSFVQAVGSLVLALPTRFAHAQGEQVRRLDDTLFVAVEKALITRATRLPDVAALSGRLRVPAGRSVACGDDVTLTLGGATVAQRVAGTRFVRQSGNRCVFVAKTENGIGRLELDLSKRTWNAQVIRPDLERLANPAVVGLTIGDDAGSETVRFRTSGPLWTYDR